MASNTEQAVTAQQALTSEVKKTGEAAKKGAAGFDEMTILSLTEIVRRDGKPGGADWRRGEFDGSALETIGEQSETLGKIKKFLEPRRKYPLNR